MTDRIHQNARVIKKFLDDSLDLFLKQTILNIQ